MAKYKVQPNETWSTIAAKFKLPVPKLMSANSGTTTLSTGMGIRVPQYSTPIGPQRIGVTSSVGGLNAAQSNARSGPYDNNLTGYYNDAYSKPPTTAYPNVLAQEQGRGLPTPTVTGRGTGNFAMNAQPSQGVSPSSGSPWVGVGNTTPWGRNPNYRGYGTGLYYEHDAQGRPYYQDPYTGQVTEYRNVQMRDSGGRPVTDAQGQPIVTPASMYQRDVEREAYRAGQTVTEFTNDMRANGYTQFGGMWVYVAPPPPKIDYSRPLRNANGNLVRRREPTSTPIQFDDTGTASTNFGVGAG